MTIATARAVGKKKTPHAGIDKNQKYISIKV
jgi:hypothetical protein